MAGDRSHAGNKTVQLIMADGTKLTPHGSYTPNVEYTVAEQRSNGIKDVRGTVVNDAVASFAVQSSVAFVHELKTLVEAFMGALTEEADEDTGLSTFRGTFNSVEAVNHTRFSVAHGEVGNATRMDNCVLSEFGVNFAKSGEMEVTGTLVGGQLVNYPGFSTTDVSELPDDQLLPTFGVLAIGEQMPTLDNPLVNLNPDLHGTSLAYSGGSNVEADPWFDGRGPGASNYAESTERTQELTVWVEHNSAGKAMIAALEQGKTLYSSFVATGSNGSKFTLLNTIRVTGTGARETQSTKYGSSFTLRPVYNAAWGGATQLEIVKPTLA